MDEFEARRSAAYVSQHDLHMGELTVRETVNFSAKCQGIGHRYGKTNISKQMDNKEL
jgi:ABC-type multidrug transport system ATPase subunit